MPVGLGRTCVRVVVCPLDLVVTNTVVMDSGTVVIVLPTVLVVVKVIGAVKENWILVELVAPVGPLEIETPGLGLLLDVEVG
jgi:hypothetical protein